MRIRAKTSVAFMLTIGILISSHAVAQPPKGPNGPGRPTPAKPGPGGPTFAKPGPSGPTPAKPGPGGPAMAKPGPGGPPMTKPKPGWPGGIVGPGWPGKPWPRLPIVVPPPVGLRVPPYITSYPPSNPIIITAPSPLGQPATIQVVNPPTSGVTLNYYVGDQVVSLAAGNSQILNQVSVIRFDRGNFLGTVQYTLYGGTYAFRMEPDGGWDLYRTGD